MQRFKYVAAVVVGFGMAALPLAASADGASASVLGLSPGTSVVARSAVTFSVETSGFSSPTYQLTDSFPNSSATASNVNPGGQFSWVPGPSDVGVHTFTIAVRDFSGNNATVTQTITVEPPPSISIGPVSPGTNLLPGTKLTFSVSAPGFSSPTTFIAGDSFSGSTVSDSNIDSLGNFSWTPDASQDGTHTITIYATDQQGHSANASETVLVGPGATLVVTGLSPGASLSPGQTLTFNVGASNFSPTSYSVGDSFPGSSVSNADISTSGAFTWTPQAADVGTHVLTVLGQVGVYGESATTTQTIQVLGPGGVPASTPTATASTAATVSATSATGSTLSALESQLTALESQLTTQSSGTTVSAAAQSGISFDTDLSKGSESTEVTQLQTVLAQQGFFSGTPTGYYGAATAAAVAAFQAEHSLPQLGIVGPATRAALNALVASPSTATTTETPTPTPTSTASASNTVTASSYDSSTYVFQNLINPGDSGTDVIELQLRLIAQGYLQAWPTGYYGSATETAVKAFQSAHDISTTGSVGPSTRSALND